MENINKEITDAVLEIMQKYFDKDFDGLDGDEVDEIVKNIYFELNLINGNITQKEYEKGLNKKKYLKI